MLVATVVPALLMFATDTIIISLWMGGWGLLVASEVLGIVEEIGHE